VFDPQRGFVDPLISWHERNGRHDLPWREPDRTPFEVLIAEIMLQRTTAEAVAGAYRPFTARYPTPGAIVATPTDEIEARVAPLGLVKRAAYIRQCASQILARHAGDVPREFSELVNLHGVGEYTARSVLIHVRDLGWRPSTRTSAACCPGFRRATGMEPDHRPRRRARSLDAKQ